jgi:hypothetical protein
MKVSAEQIERIKGLGYTESEAHFLYILADHSGYCTLHQFCTFAHAARGKHSFLFARKLLQSEHTSMCDYPGVGPVFHLFSGTVYGQMEKDNLRNGHVSPLTVGPERSEACTKQDHHPALHASRHPRGDAKLLGA